MSNIDPLRGDPSDQDHHRLVNMIRPEPTDVQLHCAWAWHQGATAALGWTECNDGVYPGSLFPHNPYETIEEEP